MVQTSTSNRCHGSKGMFMSNLSRALELAKLYATPMPQATSTKEDKSYRVVVGKVFLQPAGVSKQGKDASGRKTKIMQNPDTWKYHYPYVGFLDDNGETISGFSIDSAKLLELADAGFITDAVLECFKAYAERYSKEGRVVLKV